MSNNFKIYVIYIIIRIKIKIKFAFYLTFKMVVA